MPWPLRNSKSGGKVIVVLVVGSANERNRNELPVPTWKTKTHFQCKWYHTEYSIDRNVNAKTKESRGHVRCRIATLFWAIFRFCYQTWKSNSVPLQLIGGIQVSSHSRFSKNLSVSNFFQQLSKLLASKKDASRLSFTADSTTANVCLIYCDIVGCKFHMVFRYISIYLLQHTIIHDVSHHFQKSRPSTFPPQIVGWLLCIFWFGLVNVTTIFFFLFVFVVVERKVRHFNWMWSASFYRNIFADRRRSVSMDSQWSLSAASFHSGTQWPIIVWNRYRQFLALDPEGPSASAN